MSNIKKSAKYDNFVINRAENNSVSVIYKPTIKILRQIADEVGLEIQDSWGPQTVGRKLIDFLNENPHIAQSSQSSESEVDADDEEDDNSTAVFDEDNLISDEDWNWWVSLSDALKYVLLKSRVWEFQDEVCEDFPTWEDDELQSEVDLNDRKIMGNFVAGNITGYYNEEGDFEGEVLEYISVPDYVFGLIDLDKLSHLKHLESVSFYYNEIDMTPEGMGKLTQVKELKLNRNEIRADSLGELSTLTNLEILNLSDNLLSGKAEVYEPLTKLTNLKELNLSGNRINSESVGILEKISQLTNLEKIDLSHNTLDEHDFSSLSSLTHLKELKLYSCLTITDDVLKALSALPNLETLDLSYNKVAVDSFDLDLSQLVSLKELTLDGKSVSAELLSAVVTIPNLEKFILNEGGEGDNTAKAIERANFSKLIHLKELELDSVNLSAKTLAEIGKLSNLESLKLNGSYDGSNAIEQFDCEQLVNLKSLNLSQRPVMAIALSKISILPNLETLNLEKTSIDISWDEFALLKQMPKLRNLDIRGNGISSDKLSYLEPFASGDNPSFYLSISSWDDNIEESEEFKKLAVLFEENGFYLR